VIPGTIEPEHFADTVSELAAQASRVYVHVDLDSLDISEARANPYAAAGGPSLERLSQCVRLTCEQFTVAGAALTAYDPALDQTGRTLAAARRIATDIAEGARVHRRVKGPGKADPGRVSLTFRLTQSELSPIRAMLGVGRRPFGALPTLPCARRHICERRRRGAGYAQH
jgi:Arginase family